MVGIGTMHGKHLSNYLGKCAIIDGMGAHALPSVRVPSADAMCGVMREGVEDDE